MQVAADRDQFAPLMVAVERKGKAARAEFRVGGQGQQLLARGAQDDLRVGALQGRAGQAKQDAAAPVEVSRAARGVAQVRRPLVQARAIALDMQDPAGGLREPVAQFAFVAAHGMQCWMRRGHQWAHQQGAQGVAPLVFAVAREYVLDLCGVGPTRAAFRRGHARLPSP